MIVYTGETATLNVTVSNSDGDPIDLTDAELTWQLKRRAGDLDPPVMSLEEGDGIEIADSQTTTGKGQLTVTLTAEQTAELSGPYVYDMWMVLDDSTRCVVSPRPLLVIDGVNSPD